MTEPNSRRSRSRPARGESHRHGSSRGSGSGDSRRSGSTGGNVWNQRRDSRPDDRDEASLLILPTPLQNGRQLAWAVLQEYDRSDRFVQDILASLDGTHSLSSADRALAVDVASGVVRRSRTLDVLLESRLTRPRHKVEPDLWRVLRIGAYQLLFSRTPEHAAVDSTVDLCRDLGRDRWTGFVNGILRNVGRLIRPEPANGPASASLPIADGIWKSLQESVFCDPEQDFVTYVADAFSLPVFLASRWNQRFSRAELLSVGFQSVSPPSVTLRVNPLNVTAAELIPMLTAVGCVATAGSLTGSIRLAQGHRPDLLPGFSTGLWSVQDEAAMHASLLLAPQPGERILDLCAAPGGKTTHLAELSGDRAEIVACDVGDSRLRRVRENADRLQLSSIRTVQIEKDGTSIPQEMFDAVLVDVPCSNTGVLNRRPEARWRVDQATIQELVIIQTRLLLQACERVRPGGRVVYSTCSLEPEENRGVVDAVLRGCPDFRLVQEVLHIPGQPADGAYQALLHRTTPAATGRLPPADRLP